MTIDMPAEEPVDAKPAVTLAPVVYSKGYTNWVLVLLALIYACNSMDRYILNIIAQPVKLELNISDTQLGLLSGLAFGLFYAIFGYPLARLSERAGRINVITFCILLWSGMAALCGTAANFTQLMIYRFGVGIGESGLAAPAHSLLSDHFPPTRRTSAIAFFSSGVPVGSLIGAICGGWIAQNYGWRAAFIIISLPGFLLAPLLRFTVREPARGNTDTGRLVGAPPVKTPPLTEVIGVLFATRTYRNFCTAGVATMFFASGGLVFTGAYFVRRFHLDYATVGLVIGLISGFASLVGTFFGGYLTDRFGKRDKRWYALLPAVAIGTAAPLIVLGFLQTDWRIQAAIMLVSGALTSLTTVPFYGVTQNLVPARMRASAAAVMFFMINLVLGIGPVLIGMIIDAVTNRLFAERGFGDFVKMCGKGGSHVAPGPLGDACHLALAEATRWSLTGSAAGFVIAVTFYLLASRTIAQDLTAAAESH